jgi:hypothetical protein
LKAEIDTLELESPQIAHLNPSGPRRYPRSLAKAAGQ